MKALGGQCQKLSGLRAGVWGGGGRGGQPKSTAEQTQALSSPGGWGNQRQDAPPSPHQGRKCPPQVTAEAPAQDICTAPLGPEERLQMGQKCPDSEPGPNGLAA